MAAAMLLVAHAQSQTRMRDIFAETPDSKGEELFR